MKPWTSKWSPGAPGDQKTQNTMIFDFLGGILESQGSQSQGCRHMLVSKIKPPQTLFSTIFEQTLVVIRSLEKLKTNTF